MDEKLRSSAQGFEHRVAQCSRDGMNETELITIIERDGSTLNKVILSFFAIFGDLLELLILMPALVSLSAELTMITAVAIPLFVTQQLSTLEQVV